MAEKKQKFATPEQAARRTGKLGWAHKTDVQLQLLMKSPATFTACEAANLARIATALERIARSLEKITKSPLGG